jgi:hypothetical protein
MKILKDPIGNRNRDHPACMQCLNQQRFRVQHTEFTGFFFSLVHGFFPENIEEYHKLHPFSIQHGIEAAACSTDVA